MKLSDLLKDIYQGEVPSRFAADDIRAISSDSREVNPGSLFVALQGPDQNGTRFIPEAVARGAAVIVCGDPDHPAAKTSLQSDVCLLKVRDAFRFLKEALIKLYGDPSQKVAVIGITGTNGKTTTAYFLESIVNAAGKTSGVMGTVNHRIGPEIIPAKNTTPGMVENHLFLSRLAEHNIPCCIMEVSSHALQQGRVDNITFACAVFTNLTLDHLDYHRDMDSYFKAKALLFDRLSPKAAAILNSDDPYARRLADLTQAKILRYGLDPSADVRAESIALDLSGSQCVVVTPSESIRFKTRLIGEHNIYNILAATAAALSQGISPAVIRKGIQQLDVIPGRLEAVDCGQDFHVFVDYAHTDDALQNVLKNLRAISKQKIITVFGCGGNRDTTKRPKMGRIAGDLSDWSIVTNDNPRNEDPEDIAKQVLKGFQDRRYEVILDRKEAIVKALSMAQKGDVVLVAGKGHENYQIFKDRTIHFDDREVIRTYFKK
jgi:UDP-N-acetylmuramoyl-L-alanyl-D-glutamate--2,6-diaminopimelate ligase